MEADLIIYNYQAIFLLAVLCLFTVVFYFMYQLVNYGMKRKLYYLLSYFFGSILFINLFVIYLWYTNQAQRITEFIPLLLQIIGMFGIIFVTCRSLYFVFKRLVKKALKVRRL
ncbi:hypothetical protein [Oceanobacillus sp. CAU 1775]